MTPQALSPARTPVRRAASTMTPTTRSWMRTTRTTSNVPHTAEGQEYLPLLVALGKRRIPKKGETVYG